MKIIYGVCGEGMGHAVRSKAVINSLGKHDLLVIAGDRAYPYLKKHVKRIIPTISFRIVYYRNRVQNIITVLYNILRFPIHIVLFFHILFTMMSFKPDIVINDFDHVTNWAANILRIPVITIDNELIISKTSIERPHKSWLSYLKTLIVLKIIVPTARHHIIPTYFFPALKKENVTLIHSILRTYIVQLKPQTKNYFLVYQTSTSNKKLLRTLQKLPYRFIIYGFHKKTKENNCTFKPFDGPGFCADLKNCKGVITNGGFTLITEALYLRKPILSLPVGSQFEQQVNAHYLHKMGYGLHAQQLTPAIMMRFVRNIPLFRKKLKTYKHPGSTSVMGEIRSILHHHAK